MNSVQVRNIKIGEGIPKICVPLVGTTKEEVIAEAKKLASLPVDVAEWRADWFESCCDICKVTDVSGELRTVLKDIPLLFTFRTKREGGKKELGTEAYTELNKSVAAAGYVDLIDVEFFTGENAVKEMIEEAHKRHVKVISSSHDFDKTPGKEELVDRLRKMQSMGADILKLAVMPRCEKDVLTLLAATEEMKRKYANSPLVTMSMSGTGVISRLCGEIFGSAMTFGAAGKLSAPGQPGVEELSEVLKLLHRNL